MGDIGVLIINTIVALITVLSLILGFASYKAYKMKESLNEDKGGVIRYIPLLEEAMKKLNNALRSHDRRLDDQLHELSDIKERLDILESGHPDSDIDYGEVDDDANVIAVWFNGKKYIPEDKRNEDASTFYADNKVVAETTRPDPHSESRYKCSDCVRFRRERIDGKWCGICSVDKVIMANDEQYICDKFRLYKTTGELVCNNYEKAYAATKGEVDYPYIQYKNMSGNGRAAEEAKYIVKLNYLASDDECDELLKRVERLNRIYDAGLMSLSEYGEILKEWMQK